MNNMDSFEFKDFEDESVKQEKEARKIKFKNISFTNIGKKFDQFRIDKLEKKLVKAKEKILDTQLFNSDMKNDAKAAEGILLYRSKAVAKLEAELTFLETGKYVTVKMVESRAIKLKDLMMKNLEKNVYGMFAVPEDKKQNIFETQPQNVESETEKTIKEEAEKLNNKINAAQNQENEASEETENTAEDNFENITVEEAKETVDKSFEDESENISTVDVENVVNQDLSQAEDEAENTYVNEPSGVSPIENIKVKDVPEIPAATVNAEALKGINDDIFGRNNAQESEEKTEDSEVTEENEEDKTSSEERVVPIVVPEREEVNYLEKTKEDLEKLDELYVKLAGISMEDKNGQAEIHDEIEKIENEIINYKENLTDEELNQLENMMEAEEVDSEDEEKEKVEENDESKENDIKFDYSETTVADIEKIVENTKSTEELTAMLDRINILKQEEARTQERLTKAKEEEEEKNRIYNETMAKFIEYGKDLTDKCNQNLEKENEIRNKAKAKDDAINSMLAAMENETSKSEQKKK